MKRELTQYLKNENYVAVRKLADGKRSALSKLWALTFSTDEDIRWRAVEAIGMAASIWVRKDIEFVRDFCRRILWSLNDESGNVGWFAPQALGAILGENHQQLPEFLPLLLAVLDGDEDPQIVCGMLWALGRIGPVNDEFAERAERRIRQYLKSADSDICSAAMTSLKSFGGLKNRCCRGDCG